MYNGIVNIDNLDANEILELLGACDELCFDELLDDLQNFLIEEENEWIQENLIHLYKYLLENPTFNLLQDHCIASLYDNPEASLKSDEIVIIEKPIFMSILKKDDLNLKEIDVWDCVVRWGTGQVENLDEIKRRKEI